MSARTVLFLVGSRREASVRFRVEQYLPHLERRGWVPSVVETQGSLARRLAVLRGAGRYERLVVHRVLLSAAEALLLRACAPGYVFDFDDAIMLRDSPRGGEGSWQRAGRLAGMLRGAAIVAAGNPYLAAWAEKRHPHVVVLPTALELGETPPARSPCDDVIGWIGTRPNLRYLASLLPALVRVAAARPTVRLRIVCDAPFEASGIVVENVRWSPSTESRELAGFSIGIMPLIDDAWTRGKCGAKILQYFGAAAPVVASPVGENRELVRHDVNGFLASTEREWVDRLLELLGDADLAARLGTAGRRWVEQHRSIATMIDRFLGLLEKAGSATRRGDRAETTA